MEWEIINVYFLTFSKTHKKSVGADLISTFIHLSVVLYLINITWQFTWSDKYLVWIKLDLSTFWKVRNSKQKYPQKFALLVFLQSSKNRVAITERRAKCMHENVHKFDTKLKVKNSLLQNFIIDYQIVKRQPEYTFPCTFWTKFSTKSMRHTVSVNKYCFMLLNSRLNP